MKTILNTVVLTALLTLGISGQVTNSPTVKGTVDIRYNTRTQRDGNVPKVGVTDKYTLQVNVADSAIFRGTVDARPHIAGKVYGVNQTGLLTYDLNCDVVNPKNPAQTKNVGKLFGTVPVSEKNVYNFEGGNVKVSVLGLGNAQGFESKFSGIAIGKPPAVAAGMFTKMKKEAMNIGRSVDGKQVNLVVSNYDLMQFQNHVLPAGPVQFYPEVTVNGMFVYDYARSAWYVKDITCAYTVGNVRYQDRLSGNIRLVEAPDHKLTGKGEYQFDVRVNEPVATEVAVFDNSTSDESAFFATETNVAALQGTMVYKDVLAGETVTASQITINLLGSKLTKQQTMYLTKLFILSSIVPLNAE